MSFTEEYHIISKHQVVQLHLLAVRVVKELGMIACNIHESCEIFHRKDKQKLGEWITLFEASLPFKSITYWPFKFTL